MTEESRAESVRPWVRYRIQGSLIAQSPLHPGSGATINKPLSGARDERPGQDIEPEIQQVLCDSAGRPIIPGSTIKGLFHQQARNLPGADMTLLEQLYGRQAEDKIHGRGGRLLFQDAVLRPEQTIPPLFDPSPGKKIPMDWDPGRFTYVAPGTAIDRRTRTVEEAKLYCTGSA
ncbi:MAG: hypothetical protein KKB20_22885 [Proteobacteria bacterium]|nr:hypothetical protein [Pseudomonadota bacterium]